MFRNNFKIAFRGIRNNRVFSFINILGLAIGMACCLFILLWIQDEMSYDRFHKNVDRLYRVTDYEKYSNGEEVYFTQNPPALAQTLLQDYPEIENVTRLRRIGSVVVQNEDVKYTEDRIAFVDPAFLSMFSYPLLHGNVQTVLDDPNSIVITEEISEKYFGVKNAVGEQLQLNSDFVFRVSGILKKLPANSHHRFEFLINMKQIENFGMTDEGWSEWAFTTYVQLAPNVDHLALIPKIKDVLKNNSEGAIAELGLQRLTDIHLHSGNMWGIGGEGDIKYVYVFSIIALLILVLACINFMNLSTAKAGKRAKEIGLRKVVGARRGELVRQFYGESVLLAIISMLFSLIIVESLLPIFNIIAGKNILFYGNLNLQTAAMIVSVVALTGLLAGSYPALFLSAFRPVQVLKTQSGDKLRGAIFRKILVSFQFLLTIVLIIGVFVVNRQLQFIRSQKLGFDKEQVICLRLKGNLNQHSDRLKNALRELPEIASISAVSRPPSGIKTSAMLNNWEGRGANEQVLFYLMGGDYELAETIGLKVLQGRYFSREFVSDTTDGYVVNEAAIRAIGMNDPLGKKLGRGKILGVVKDFHFSSLHSKIGPLIIHFSPGSFNYFLVKIKSNHLGDALKRIGEKWNTLAPEYPFEYTFLDDRLENLYRVEHRVEKVVNSFSVLALVIACMGLFGLASFAAEQRTKEIGIRKVLGAKVSGLIALLAREFTKYVFLANLLAWPIAYFGMKNWLENFAYHIEISPAIFILSGLLVFAIALLTVVWQAWSTAVSNPIKSLRYE